MSTVAWNIQNGQLDAVKELVNAENINEIYTVRTAIQIASDYGQAEIVEYLISVGANINTVDKYGICPLLSAVWENHLEVVKVLLAHGANRDFKAPDGTDLVDCTENEEIRNLLKNSA